MFALGLSLVVLAAGLWVGWRYIETKSMACECSDPVDQARFALLNPFRDGEPERVAINVVKARQAGKCQVVGTGVTYCPEGMHADVASWKLTGRTSVKDGLVFRFWVTRPPRSIDADDGDPLWVAVSRNGKSWKVDHVDTYH
jgi:hypothetical protein